MSVQVRFFCVSSSKVTEDLRAYLGREPTTEEHRYEVRRRLGWKPESNPRPATLADMPES